MSSISPGTDAGNRPSTAGGSFKVKRIKKEPSEGRQEKEKEKVFECDKCPKKYARRDYLERHLLNHDARNYQCPACGKGFARVDVLKKHELNACKMSTSAMQGGKGGVEELEGSGNGGAKEKEKEKGKVGKRPILAQRPQSQEGSIRGPDPPISSRRWDDGAGPSTGGLWDDMKRKRQRQGRRQRSESQSSGGGQGSGSGPNSDIDIDRREKPGPAYEDWAKAERVEVDRRYSTASQAYSDYPRPGQGYGQGQDHRHAFDHGHGHGQYVPQPPLHGHGQYTSSQRYTPFPTAAPVPVHLPPLHIPSTTTSNFTYPAQMPLISPTQPTQRGGDMSLSLAPPYAPTPVPPSPPKPTEITGPIPYDQPQIQEATWDNDAATSEFEMPAKVGENMDDLLSWLFNTNAPGTGSEWTFGQGGGGQMGDMGHQFLPTFNIDPVAGHLDAVPGQRQETVADVGIGQYPAHQSGNTYTDAGTTVQIQQVQTSSATMGARSTQVPIEQPVPTTAGHDPGTSAQQPCQSQAQRHEHHQGQEQGPTVRRYPQPIHPLYVPNIPGKTNIPTFDRIPMPKGQRERYSEVIDEETKAAMMDMFERPGKEALSSPAFSIHRMRLYLELYFMHFAPLYPIIHQPSLLYRRLPPDLLLALICIGSAFAEDKEGLRIASFLHKRLRNRIFEMVEDEPKASVHNLQTLLLINHFSRSYCSLKEHGISQIFHSPSVYMIRLAGTLLPRFNRQNPPSDDPITCWLDWVGEEERKRLGWFAFMMDLENAALYRHFLMIHCYFMEIPFPTSSSSWTAPDPFQWSIALRESLSIPTPSFRNALRELAGRGQIPNGLNDQSLWILIHGLINVSWTLLWRDLGELSMVHENKITGWKDSLRRAFRIWVGHVEGRAAGSRCEEALYTVGIPFAQLGSILLLSDTEMIRIFAGAANIAGRTISPGEWTAANTYVHAWAKSQDGAYACYTAIELLSQVYKWSAEDRWSTAPAFIPWCAYISSLIIWAYSTVLDGPDSLQAPYIIPSTTRTLLEHGQTSEIRIEPSLARRAAQTYLADMLSKTGGEVFALPDVKGKNACAGVLAYTAYLVGIGGRGVLEEARRVLLGLLGEG